MSRQVSQTTFVLDEMIPAQFYYQFTKFLMRFKTKSLGLGTIAYIFLSVLQVHAQSTASRVKVKLDAQHTIEMLAALGVETDHGDYRAGRGFTSEFTSDELQRIKQAGFTTYTVIPDLKIWREQQNQLSVERSSPCQPGGNAINYTTPTNYIPGSYGGGYFTYQEMMLVLESMTQKFPHLVSPRSNVNDTLTTHQGRKLQYVKISDNPVQNETEPQVLFTALHHAREPNSASQMLFYMWYLLENYDTNPEIRYILNNTELYFIPCVNPDGYIRNEIEEPAGGGFWRKNMRDNQDGTFGVDLNRNYGFQWGHDNIGSSPNTQSDIYRGPAAFSEPESRIIKSFCETHAFKFALNYHTFSNLLIYPWAWSDEVADSKFTEYASLLVSENNYLAGVSTQTVGYQVNGSSDDYMYGARNIVSFTPEVGPRSTGFWPPASDIDKLNKDALKLNLLTSQLPLNLAIPSNEQINLGAQNTVTFNIKRFGLLNGLFQINVVPKTPASGTVTTGIQQVTLSQFETKPMSFAFTPNANLKNGDTLRFEILIDNGAYTRLQKVEAVYTGQVLNILNHPLTSIAGFQSTHPTDWKLTTETFLSAPTSCTDSPGVDYRESSVTSVVTTNAITIPATATAARLLFHAKWLMEDGYDFVTVNVGTNNNLNPQCATHTTTEAIGAFGVPVFTGYQFDKWNSECVDLLPFKGQSVKFGFTLNSDAFATDDGFYFDDVKVEYTSTSGTETIDLQDFSTISAYPNPTKSDCTVSWQNINSQAKEIRIADAHGKIVLNQIISNHSKSVEVRLAQLPIGVYQAQVIFQNGMQLQTLINKS